MYAVHVLYARVLDENSCSNFLFQMVGSFSIVNWMSWSFLCSVKSGTIRNVESACVSFPGQLKRVSTDESATQELDKGTALIDANTTIAPSLSPHPTSQSASGPTCNTITSTTLSEVDEAEEQDELEEKNQEDSVPLRKLYGIYRQIWRG